MSLAEIAKTYNEEQIQVLHMFLMRNYQEQLNGELSPVENAIMIMKGEINEG